MLHGSEQPGAREWELWILIVGACLGGKVARDMVFAAMEPNDCPYPILRPVLAALKADDTEGAKKAIDDVYFLHGTNTSGGTLKGIVDRVSETAAKRNRILTAERNLAEARGK